MSHLFISYAHKDKQHLQGLLTWLKGNDFTDNQIWYDNIEGGDNWREEISSALDEAFAVVVIVTVNSMQSHYCTYEWSYALGQGIPLIPLLFDDVPAKDFHAPLAAKQYIDCTQEIPTSLKPTIRQHKSIPPQIKTINEMVYDAIELTHRRFFVLFWLGKHNASLSDDLLMDVIGDFSAEADKTLKIINGLMLERAYTIKGRQYRYCWLIQGFLAEISELRQIYRDRNVHFHRRDFFEEILISRFENEWLPAFKYFDADDWWERTTHRYFTSELLFRGEIFSEIVRVFPRFFSTDVEYMVDDIMEKLKRDQENNE